MHNYNWQVVLGLIPVFLTGCGSSQSAHLTGSPIAIGAFSYTPINGVVIVVDQQEYHLGFINKDAFAESMAGAVDLENPLTISWHEGAEGAPESRSFLFKNASNVDFSKTETIMFRYEEPGNWSCLLLDENDQTLLERTETEET